VIGTAETPICPLGFADFSRKSGTIIGVFGFIARQITCMRPDRRGSGAKIYGATALSLFYETPQGTRGWVELGREQEHEA
jgi:hypothetical protein